MSKLDIRARQSGPVTILDLSGQLTLDSGYGSLGESVAKLLGDGHRRILINLRDVSFIDSAGLGEMVRSHASALKHGGKLKLEHLSARLAGLLRITKLDMIFEHYSDEQEAIRSF